MAIAPRDRAEFAAGGIPGALALIVVLMIVLHVCVAALWKSVVRKRLQRQNQRQVVERAAALAVEEQSARTRRLHLMALQQRSVRKAANKRVKLVRRHKIRLAHLNSEWWKLFTSAKASDPSTRDGRKFRRRFRVPPSEVRWAVELVRKSKKWAEGPDAVGAYSIPMELLVMGSLQVLGRAVPFDLAAEGAHVSEVGGRCLLAALPVALMCVPLLISCHRPVRLVLFYSQRCKPSSTYSPKSAPSSSRNIMVHREPLKQRRHCFVNMP